jgi:hypothetical protein
MKLMIAILLALSLAPATAGAQSLVPVDETLEDAVIIQIQDDEDDDDDEDEDEEDDDD